MPKGMSVMALRIARWSFFCLGAMLRLPSALKEKGIGGGCSEVLFKLWRWWVVSLEATGIKVTAVFLALCVFMTFRVMR